MAKRGKWVSLWALWRFVRSRESGASPKLLLVLALLYVVVPTDLVPDMLPLAGWLDDIGVVALVLGWIRRSFRRSQTRPSAPTDVQEPDSRRSRSPTFPRYDPLMTEGTRKPG